MVRRKVLALEFVDGSSPSIPTIVSKRRKKPSHESGVCYIRLSLATRVMFAFVVSVCTLKPKPQLPSYKKIFRPDSKE